MCETLFELAPLRIAATRIQRLRFDCRRADSIRASRYELVLRSFRFAQQIFNALPYSSGLVEDEEHFRRAPHMQPLHQFVAHVALSRPASPSAWWRVRLVARQADEHPHRAHVRRPCALRSPSPAPPGAGPSIPPPASGSLRCEFPRRCVPSDVLEIVMRFPSSSKYSTSCETKSRPNTRSDSAAISASDFSRCPASPEIVTTPMRERCHVS